MAFMRRIERRWDRRATGLELLSVESSIESTARAQALWDFLITPESAVLTGENVLKVSEPREHPRAKSETSTA